MKKSPGRPVFHSLHEADPHQPGIGSLPALHTSLASVAVRPKQSRRCPAIRIAYRLTAAAEFDLIDIQACLSSRSALAFTSSWNCASFPIRIHDCRSLRNIAFNLLSLVAAACASHAAAFSQALSARSPMALLLAARKDSWPKNAQWNTKFHDESCSILSRKCALLFSRAQSILWLD
jgi:hypothetical protein